MSAKITAPCAVNGRDTMEITAYSDGSFEFVSRVGGKETYIVLSRENFLRMCAWGLDSLMKKVGGV
jgi:hypothetical protein